jgi:hypothetical protein
LSDAEVFVGDGRGAPYRGSTDAEPFGKLHDRAACPVVGDESVDVCGAKSGLRTMPRRGRGSPGVASGSLLAARSSVPARGLNSVPMRRAAAVRDAFGMVFGSSEGRAARPMVPITLAEPGLSAAWRGLKAVPQGPPVVL